MLLVQITDRRFSVGVGKTLLEAIKDAAPRERVIACIVFVFQIHYKANNKAGVTRTFDSRAAAKVWLADPIIKASKKGTIKEYAELKLVPECEIWQALEKAGVANLDWKNDLNLCN